MVAAYIITKWHTNNNTLVNLVSKM